VLLRNSIPMIEKKAPARKLFLNAVLLTLGYALFFYAFQLVLFRIGLFTRLPDAWNLQRWDAAWYRSVGFDGYSYASDRQTTSGFFWLFPAVWRLVGCDALVMSFINVVFLALGFGVLALIFDLSTRDKILWLSTPVIFFSFVPYAEALFFCLTCFCLLGISRRRHLLVAAMLFLMALTRATAVFVVPAFLAMEVMAGERRDFFRSLARGLVQYVLPSFLGLGLFVVLQYRQTGVWFAYFRAQAECWKRVWATPVLPLFSSGGYLTIWLNALAVFCCFTALVYVLVLFGRWLSHGVKQDRIVSVAMAYLGVALFSTLFYSPQWQAGHTDVIGTFRYTMLSPFFFGFLHSFTHNREYKWWHYVTVIIYCSAVWMAFGAYVHIREFLFFSANTLIVVLYMKSGKQREDLYWPFLLMFNFFLQVHFFQQFLIGASLVD